VFRAELHTKSLPTLRTRNCALAACPRMVEAGSAPAHEFRGKEGLYFPAMAKHLIVNQERESKRYALAEAMWRAPYSQLLRYGISSYREVTNLDKVGVPVWISHRPLATTISVNAGKSDDWLMAFAGAITEGIEFWAAENPWGKSVTASHAELEQGNTAELLPFKEYPLANESLCNAQMQIEWEEVERITLGEGRPLAWMPSDCVWMEQRSPTQFINWQASSNGVAGGIQPEDAVLSALYEVIERDGWTLQQCLIQATGGWPRKIPLSGLPDELDRLVAKARGAGLSPFLFDVTTDLGVPVFGCSLFDTNHASAGTFGGYGSSLNPLMAARRALLESFQSRLCYISGARDDLYRRDFLLLKKADQNKAVSVAEKLTPVALDWSEFAEGYGGAPFFETVNEEIEALLARLFAKGITKIYRKILAEEYFSNTKLTLVRVIAPQLEGLKFDQWRSNGRAISYVREQLKDKSARAA
jgi:YcaO-like protein with predicted kinase domain